MKTIGLLGGMSWESTIGYYRIINEGIKQRLGGFHSAKIVLYRVDFEPIETLQRMGDWQAMGDMLALAARNTRHFPVIANLRSQVQASPPKEQP